MVRVSRQRAVAECSVEAAGRHRTDVGQPVFPSQIVEVQIDRGERGACLRRQVRRLDDGLFVDPLRGVRRRVPVRLQDRRFPRPPDILHLLADRVRELITAQTAVESAA